MLESFGNSFEASSWILVSWTHGSSCSRLWCPFLGYSEIKIFHTTGILSLDFLLMRDANCAGLYFGTPFSKCWHIKSINESKSPGEREWLALLTETTHWLGHSIVGYSCCLSCCSSYSDITGMKEEKGWPSRRWCSLLEIHSPAEIWKHIYICVLRYQISESAASIGTRMHTVNTLEHVSKQF